MLGWMIWLGCSGDSEAPEQGPGLQRWSEPGAYRVGYRELALPWTAPPLQAEERTLPVALWYPTEDEAGAAVRYQGLIDAPGVLGEATPVERPAPVLVFSHGHQAFAQASSFLMEHFASHGWWVFAPDHVGNTTFDPPTRETAIYWQRPLDLSRVLDLAEEVAPSDGTVVLAGHSFGGYTAHALAGARYSEEALQGCLDGSDDSEFCSTMTPEQAERFRAGFLDPRLDALISMAPGDFRLFGDGLGEVSVPTLLMTGGLDPGTDGDPIWSALAHPDDLRVHLPTGGHNAFTDFSGVLDGSGTIDPEEGFFIVRTYALAFADLYGRQDRAAQPIVDGTEEVSPDCGLQSHES